MPEIKLQHILTLVELLSKGARHNFVEVTTTELGKSIGRSQQAASKHLLDLENSGYIERAKKGQKFAVRVTDKGYSEIQSLFFSMRTALESAPAAAGALAAGCTALNSKPHERRASTTSAARTGLARYSFIPASRQRARSPAIAYAVSAITGMRASTPGSSPERMRRVVA